MTTKEVMVIVKQMAKEQKEFRESMLAAIEKLEGQWERAGGWKGAFEQDLRKLRTTVIQNKTKILQQQQSIGLLQDVSGYDR